MRKICPVILMGVLLILVACREQVTDDALPPEGKIDMASLSGKQVEPGRLIVKLKQEPSPEHIMTRAGSINIKKMERVFPDAGRFEKRSRAAGLHLWYVIEYDESVAVTRAAEELSFWDDVLAIEPVVPVKRNTSSTFRPLNEGEEVMAMAGSTGSSGCDDPYLSLQWHFNNDGKINHALEGADIRLFDAWKVTKGSPEVIVAIVDGGVDYAHTDLAANMWINAAEANGTGNYDDDRNGYKDDIYGYNFVTGKAIEPTLHGTHVAGIIGAVNNNGTGVSSIAGGDGSPGSGVKLMNCQIFIDNEEGERSATNFYTAAAIKYGADNGAVISQNSWGFDLGTVSSTPLVIQAAIAYFINYAGLDEYGNQVGPMKGGLVVFAAGNDDTSAPNFPAFDANVISVAAMGPDYKKASYSNYASAIDIIAPGGEMDYDPVKARTGILSTGSGWDGTKVASNAYYYMDGTSMSCPQVSGVAALLISVYGVGKPGFTPARLKDMLLESTYDISSYNKDYQGLLGAGALDAGEALLARIDDPLPPVLIKSIENPAFTGLDQSKEITLREYFAPGEEGDKLTYEVSAQTADVVSLQLIGDVLKVTTTGYGKTYIIVVAKGENGLETQTTFLVSCNSRSVKPGKGKPGLWVGVEDLN